MKNYLAKALFTSAVAVCAAALLPAVTSAAQKTSFEGTYRLVSRQLPDGTVRTGDDATGLMTFTKSHRNLQIVWKGANGILCSYALAANYSVAAGHYSEKVLFTSLNDFRSGQTPGFDLVKRNQKAMVVSAAETAAAPTMDPPTIVLDGNRITTTAEGNFIDIWEKVEDNGGAQAANPD